MKRLTILLALSLSCVLAVSGCGKKSTDKTDMTSTHTTAAPETMAPTTKAPETTESPSKEGTTDSGDSTKESKKEPAAASSVTTSIHT